MDAIINRLLFVMRLLAGFWSLGTGLLVLFWILVYYDCFAVDSRFIAWGFFPPFAFILFFLPPFLVFWFTRNRKISFWLVLIYLIFFFGFGDFSLLNPKSARQPDSKKRQAISAVALNVRYYSFGLDKVIEAILKIDADLYLLSENEITPKQRDILVQRIAPRQFFMGRQEGTAIISKYPVLEFKEVLLPTHQASLYYENEIEKQHLNPHRSFVHALVDVNGVPVNVISIRFLAGRAKSRSPSDVLDWGFYVLKSQIQEVTFFQSYLENLKGPVIFGGDLNATPSSVVVRRLRDVSIDAYLVNHLWGNFTFWTISPKLTFARLDYLFCTNEIQPERSEILDDLISDHYPLYAEFSLFTK